MSHWHPTIYHLFGGKELTGVILPNFLMLNLDSKNSYQNGPFWCAPMHLKTAALKTRDWGPGFN
jgi:hypothetical protein